MRNVLAGFLGMAIGAVATAPARNPPETTAPAYDVRGIELAAVRLESIVPTAREPARTGGAPATTHAPATARSRQLRELVASTTDRRALGEQVPDGAHLSRTHAFRTYEDILTQFGRPDSFGVRDGLGAFHYAVDEKGQRYMTFLFHDGRVVRVDTR